MQSNGHLPVFTNGVTQQALAEGTFLRADIAVAWQGMDPMQSAFALQGDVFRDVSGMRRTLKVEIAGSDYFVKLHYGVGWKEIFKNWWQWKRPVIGAENEFVACRGLEQVGITAPVVAAYGSGVGNMARRPSFILCDALTGFATLEDLTDRWPEQPPAALTKLRMLVAIARFARHFHAQGFVHRDFYICHLLASAQLRRALFDGEIDGGIDRETAVLPELAVLDLHRARRFADVPQRWLKRDLAALLFSTLDLGYGVRDWLRFVRIYSGRPLREELRERRVFWRSVYRRGVALYVKSERKGLVKGHFQP